MSATGIKPAPAVPGLPRLRLDDATRCGCNPDPIPAAREASA